MIRQMYDPFNSVIYGFDDSIIALMIGETCYSKQEIDAKISTVFKICGEKEKVSQLPGSGEIGDVWIITETHEEYTWVKAGRWELLGPLIDLSSYATQTWVTDLIGDLGSYETVVAYLNAIANTASNAAQAAQNAQQTANNALPAATFESFKTTNTQAINAAKKAGDDAQTSLNNYKSENNQAVASIKTTADNALPSATFETFKSTNTTAINAAKKSGDDAQTSIDNFKQAQLVFEATQANIASLVDPTTKSATSDTHFSRRKTYYKLENDEYVPLVIGTDYEAMSAVADYEGTVYEDDGISVQALINKINELVAAGNLLITAHKQATVENNQEGE